MGNAILNDLTVPEVAGKLKTNIEHVRSLIRQGKIDAYKFGREYRITEDALEKYISVIKNSINKGE